MTQVEKYVKDLQGEFGEEWENYLPVYYYEHRKLLEEWGYSTLALKDEQVSEMFSNLVMIAWCGQEDYTHEHINLAGRVSTCSVMEWIYMHDMPNLDCTHFVFRDDPYLFGYFKGCPQSLVVSTTTPKEWGIDTPVEEWHEPIAGMRRIMVMEKCWIAYIGGRYYYISA